LRILPLALLAATMLVALPARAQTFGTFTGAEPLTVNGRMFGAYLQTSQDVASVVTQLRLSFYPDVDFGFQGGLARQDFGNDQNRTTLRVGGDLKFVIAKPSTNWPFSMALDAALGIETGDNFTVLTVGPKVIGSRTLATSQSVSITPYVSAGLMFSNIDVGSNSSTDLSFPVHLGGDLKISPQVDLTAEIQLRIADSFNDDVGFSFGVNLPF
jgi:hypothetical protein